MANPPIPTSELEQLTKEAHLFPGILQTCDSVFANVHAYDHNSTEKWNSAIISTLLSRLVAQTSPSASKPSPFKFVVTSTIIQHTSTARAATSSARPPTSDSHSDISALSAKGAGKRGMHAASGAYWNQEKDGMWSFKYDGESASAGGNALGREFDVVVGVVWVGL
ncbi:hypothetical protein MMC30_000621 [Trapelia coarctata]|nr:hypothetical protein [Trapelia coarctata]